METEIAKNLIEEIDSLLDIDYSGLQSVANLKTWPLWETRKLNGTINTKVISTNNHIRFVTQIPPLEEFEDQWHDCPETCRVLGGQLGDKTSGKIWNVDQIACFSKGQKHKPWNPSPIYPCFLIVDFYF